MSGPIAGYWASVGVRVDDKALKEVDAYLKKIEQRISKAGGSKGLRINAYVDEAKLTKHLQSVFSKIGKGLPLKLSNVTVDPTSLSKSIREHLAKATFRAPITAVLNRASLATVRQQLQAALVGINISPRVSSASISPTRTPSPSVPAGSGSPGRNPGRGEEAERRRRSLTGRGDPSLQEFLGGTYSRSSLTAGNRRFVDAIMQRGLGGVGGQGTLTNMAVEGGLGAIGRVGAGSMMGRGVASLGLRVAGPVGGALGLVGSGLVSGATSLVGGIWSTLGKVITTPFSMLGSAASTVTSAFYRIALAAAPLVAGFAFVNRKVQEGTQRQIALNTVSGSLGSSGQTESKWLMDMSNREGMRYDTLVQPYTSFIASASPAMGLDGAKDVFEAFTQFGLTRGAGDVSMGLAMKAVSQMAGKGTVMAEELKGQLGDAPGFGEMQGIFAEAYQMSLGRDETTAKKGQEAIQELIKAMEKGQVVSGKILPLVAEIAKARAQSGLVEARGASFAEQNRFSNQMSEGWKLFREGGGEEGIAHFWRMMQGFGQWWKDNGTQLGMYFNSAVLYLDAFQESIKELFHFAATGESTSITDLFKQNGLDVDGIRASFINLKDSIVKLLGLNEGGDGFTILSQRIVQFANDLSKVIDAIALVVRGVDKMVIPENVAARSQSEIATLAADPKNLFKNENAIVKNRLDNSPLSGLQDITRGAFGGTWNAASALKGLVFGSSSEGTFQPPKQNSYLPISLPSLQGNIPSMSPMNPANISGGVRGNEFVTHKVDVTLKVEGNQESIGLLIDSKVREGFPLMLTNEITKSMTAAPIR